MNEEPQPPRRPVGPYEQSVFDSRASRKAAEAKIARARRHKIIGIGAVVALVLGLGAGGTWWFLQRGDAAPKTPTVAGPAGKSCPTRTPVHLWVSYAMQPVAVALTQGYQAQPSAPCVEYVVQAKEPIAAMIGLGKGQPNRPDGWIPDSPRWLDKVNAATHINAKAAAPFARSPLVVAMEPSRAKEVGPSPEWLGLVASDNPIRLSDPRSTTAGMLTVSAAVPQLSGAQGRVVLTKLAQGTTSSTDELFATYNIKPSDATAFPVSEADLLEHNRLFPEHPLTGVVPAEGTPAFEYSLINVATEPVQAQAIEGLRGYFRSEHAAQVLADNGFHSTAVPSIAPTQAGAVKASNATSPTLQQVSSATDLWQSATTDFRLLAVFDVSGSMLDKVGKTTRIAVTKEAAGIALAALPKTTDLGLWVFSIGIGPKGVDYREIAPIAPLTDEAHRAKVAAAAAQLDKNVGGGTGLYDTIWAAYQRTLAAWSPDRVNAVVILTDGRNEDPNGMSFNDLMSKLAGAKDDKRPVAITTIGIGPDVDAGALRKVSELMNSAYYAAPDPGDMTTVLAKALFDHECKDGRCV